MPFEPFPPTNNTERWLAAVVEQLQALRQEIKAGLLSVVDELRDQNEARRGEFATVAGPEPEPGAPVKHVQVNRLRCSCGFSVNPANYQKLKDHLAEFNHE